MADQDESRVAAIFPSPPGYFWTDFTPENVSRMEALRAAYTSETGKPLSAASRIPDVPEDLANLQPPPEPADGKWRILGDLYTLKDELPSLEDQGIVRLGAQPATAAPVEKDASHVDKVFELKKLAKSLLLNFLELTGILSINPGDAADKLADIQTIFFNMHHHINEWRPHQTREALITLLQTQLEKTQNETRALREVTDNARRALVGLASLEVPDGSQLLGRDAEALDADGWDEETKLEAEKARGDEVWAVMDEMFG